MHRRHPLVIWKHAYYCMKTSPNSVKCLHVVMIDNVEAVQCSENNLCKTVYDMDCAF